MRTPSSGARTRPSRGLVLLAALALPAAIGSAGCGSTSPAQPIAAPSTAAPASTPQASAAPGAVVALDPATGSSLWKSVSHYDGATQLISTGGSLYLGTGDGFLVALDAASGAEQWKVKLTPNGASVHNPAAADGFVFAGTAGSGFVAVDTKTHQVAWTGDLHGDDTGTAVASGGIDRKSTRLNSSHTVISYAVFCLKKKRQLTW